LDVIAAQVIGDIALVIAVATLLGAVARRCGQPTVVGQILSGVLLGPTVLGRFPGDPVRHLFPHQTVPYLAVLAQVAVVIFMFTVGYEIEFTALRGHGRAVPLVAAGALCVPMLLGAGSVLVFRSNFAALGGRPESRSFVLFLGVALGITALPVMAAIVRERGLAGTAAGVIAMAAAGVMDVAAWLVLAAVLISAGHSGTLGWPVAMLLTGCFAAVMLLVVRPALAWWANRPQSVLSSPVPVAFTLAMSSAWVTSSLGLHPVFGGFLAGLAMRGSRPPDPDVLRSMEQAGGLLLPLFFVVTGLSLNVGAIRGNGLAMLAVILLISCAGKLGPAYALSRVSGLEPPQAATVAALVNTRGLTELIVLNVGLADGIIGPQVFTILVLMALLTTLMTGPLLTILHRPGIQRTAARLPAAEQPAGDAG
jgi:Kef-type K+ transport system membrane component KefB